MQKVSCRMLIAPMIERNMLLYVRQTLNKPVSYMHSQCRAVMIQLSYTSRGCLLCSSAGSGWGTHPLHRSVQPLQQICNLDLLGQGHDPLLVQISYCAWLHLESGRLLLAVSNVLTKNCSLPLHTLDDLCTGALCQYIQNKVLMICGASTAIYASNLAADVAAWQGCVMQGTR
jgi:hypothetical protein